MKLIASVNKALQISVIIIKVCVWSAVMKRTKQRNPIREVWRKKKPLEHFGTGVMINERSHFSERLLAQTLVQS